MPYSRQRVISRAEQRDEASVTNLSRQRNRIQIDRSREHDGADARPGAPVGTVDREERAELTRRP